MPKRLQRILVWFFVVYAIVLLFVGRHVPRLYELYVRGVPTTGVINSRAGNQGLRYIFVANGRRYSGLAQIGVASIPISDINDNVYVTYLPRDPEINVAGDVKDLLDGEYERCAEWAPIVALFVLIVFIWNVMLRNWWFENSPFAGSAIDRATSFLFGDK